MKLLKLAAISALFFTSACDDPELEAQFEAELEIEPAAHDSLRAAIDLEEEEAEEAERSDWLLEIEWTTASGEPTLRCGGDVRVECNGFTCCGSAASCAAFCNATKPQLDPW